MYIVAVPLVWLSGTIALEQQTPEQVTHVYTEWYTR